MRETLDAVVLREIKYRPPSETDIEGEDGKNSFMEALALILKKLKIFFVVRFIAFLYHKLGL